MARKTGQRHKQPRKTKHGHWEWSSREKDSCEKYAQESRDLLAKYKGKYITQTEYMEQSNKLFNKHFERTGIQRK